MEHMNSLVSHSAHLFQQILDNDSNVVYVKGLDLRYLFVNRQFTDVFRMSREEVIGRHDVELFPTELAFAYQMQHEDSCRLSIGDTSLRLEFLPHHDGLHAYRTLRFPIMNEFGTIVAIAGISTDLTDQVLARQELEALQQRYEMMFRVVGVQRQETRETVLPRQIGSVRTEPLFDTVCGSESGDVVRSRIGKLADAAWSMRTEGQRFGNPELTQYENKHVAVFEKKIVAFGDDYAEVLHRAAKESRVPVSRIVMSYWGDQSTLQTVPE